MENFGNIRNMKRLPMNYKNFKIMDVQIDADVQKEYLRMLKNVGKPPATNEAITQLQQQIMDESASASVRKKLLQKLSVADKVEALRFLERYAADAPEEIRSFAQMAAYHSKLYMESILLNEPQIVLTSGMGGKDGSLRFFVALIPASTKHLSESQKRVVQNEFNYVCQDFNAEIENDIDFSGRYPKFTMLVPLQTNPQNIVKESINACNELGKFLKNGAIITPAKILDDKEIESHWRTVMHYAVRPPMKDIDD